jgi:hypothetical protein
MATISCEDKADMANEKDQGPEIASLRRVVPFAFLVTLMLRLTLLQIAQHTIECFASGGIFGVLLHNRKDLEGNG